MRKRTTVPEFEAEWEEQISLGIKELLETKHLYQSIRLSDPTDLLSNATDGIAARSEDSFSKEQITWACGPWSVSGPSDHSYLGRGLPEGGPPTRPRVNPQLPDLKIFCGHCDRAEAHNPVSAKQCVPEGRWSAASSKVIQLFAASYLCQSCKNFPEVFLIRREDLKLTLSGRSPIERVAAPSFPPFLQDYYSEAVIAANCGYTRMSIFGLRTVIEQWARAVTQLAGRVDGSVLLQGYMDLLPAEFRSLYPSLAALYERLSADMHGAEGDSALCEQARREIESHFSALRSLPSVASRIRAALSLKRKP